jgi:2-isopropylmalate synthase
MDPIAIFDTTLRDGEQAPGFSMNTEEKLRMARGLDRLGVDVIEAGFPIASDGDFDAVRRIASEIRGPRIAGLARANRKDIERCARALEPARRSRIHVVLATSDIHLKHKLGKSRTEALELAAEAVRFAAGFCDNVQFSAEDAGRSDVDYLCKVFDAVIEAGASVINIPDTVGYCMPDEYGWLIRNIQSRLARIDGITLSVHCHNDLGLAVANSLAGVHNGARQVECTVNGIGERAGNAALEEIVMAIQVRRRFLKVSTGIHTEELYPASQLLSEITKTTVQKNKAIVGENAFAHESGIHQDGVLKESSTYEIMRPEAVGVPANRIVLGKHSGRHALRQRYHELGFELTPAELETVYASFTRLADQRKTVHDHELVLLVDEERKCSHA